VTTRVAHVWGSTPEERESPFPCDALAAPGAVACWRAVDVDAAPAVLFRWLCQLREAPYSYDWIDNRGRRSRGTLTPGLDAIEVGQTVMEIFTLASFERDRHLTLRTAGGRFGTFFVTYRVDSNDSNRCRLVVKLVAELPGGARGSRAGRALPVGRPGDDAAPAPQPEALRGARRLSVPSGPGPGWQSRDRGLASTFELAPQRHPAGDRRPVDQPLRAGGRSAGTVHRPPVVPQDHVACLPLMDVVEVGAVSLKLTGDEVTRITARETDDPGAYRHFAMGRLALGRMTPADAQRSIPHFERALARDPRYAQALASISEAWILRATGGLDAASCYDEARRSA